MDERTSRPHVPVLREAVMELLGCRAGGFYIDGTVGGGGYAKAILQASAPDGRLLALDCDADAITRVQAALSSYQSRLFLAEANFADLPRILGELRLGPADGIVLDLGPSSYQLSNPSRGFSFRLEGPLDMRMNQNLPQTAAELVNRLSQSELTGLIRQLGEERFASRIAHAIMARRQISPLSTTLELAELIAGVVPRTRDSLRLHPATRTFQALRLAVNQELASLERFLSQVLDAMKPGARLCIVAFHSLEDRIVKETFKEWAKSCICPRTLPRCECTGQPRVKLLTRKPVRPEAAEVESNPSSRSARLRAVEKLEKVLHRA